MAAIVSNSCKSIQSGGFRLNTSCKANQEPLVSVIIVVFRDRDELEKIVESVLPFAGQELEIVVIDGGSQDGTADVLAGFGDLLAFWLSEPDSGIYNAMNKGLAAAKGTYVLHLNAGDRLLAIPWNELQECKACKIDVVPCRVLLDGRTVFVSRTSLLSRIDNTWHHQGTFYRRAAHLRYADSYRMAADFDHNQRLLKAGCTIRQLSTIVADHGGNGLSMQVGRAEIHRSIRANFGPLYLLLAKMRFALMAVRKRLRQWSATS